MKYICVYCGSSFGSNDTYSEATRVLGKVIATKGITLVYGGGKNGLMGLLADSALENGGDVIGVIPESLIELEMEHKAVKDLRIVKTIHERKYLMAELADAFIALPGGYGTIEEICEMISWAQLDIHDKPSGLLNIDGYYDKFTDFLDHGYSQGFLRIHRERLLAVSDNALDLITSLETLSIKLNNESRIY